uniref:RHGBA protein n=1 Tax=Hydatigena taeniaeformis TaxID=6205 RepID=A0A0R3X6W3_HYDTA
LHSNLRRNGKLCRSKIKYQSYVDKRKPVSGSIFGIRCKLDAEITCSTSFWNNFPLRGSRQAISKAFKQEVTEAASQEVGLSDSTMGVLLPTRVKRGCFSRVVQSSNIKPSGDSFNNSISNPTARFTAAEVEL